MADLLGITNPVPNYDNTAHNRTQGNSPQLAGQLIQNIADPTRVVRADGRSERQGAENNLAGNLRYDSNVQAFLQQMRDAPDMAAILAKTLVWMRGMVSVPGLAPGIAQEMSNFLKMLQMDREQFQTFFQTQLQGGNRFSGPLFALLRQALRTTPNEHLQQAIVNFAKRYSDYSSTRHVGDTMTSLLRRMNDYLPQSWRGQLAQLTAQLEAGLQGGTRAENLKLLQGQIIPYLSRYIEQSHNMGTIRTMISLLTLNMTRYENGSEAGLLAAFRQLTGYGDLLSGLNQLDDQTVMQLLDDSAFTRAAQSDPFAQQLAETASKALQGQFGPEVREGFGEIIRSILINESVFMPLHHMIIPMEWEGNMMYSELWVDPDGEEETSQGGGSKEPKIQFLFKMDIQSLGFLEMTLSARKTVVDLDVYGDGPLQQHGALIAQDLKTILESHGLTGKHVQVQQRERPLTLTEVFPNLLEGKGGVNVKI